MMLESPMHSPLRMIAILTALTASTFAEEKEKKEAVPHRVDTNATVKIDGKEIAYRATAATLVGYGGVVGRFIGIGRGRRKIGQLKSVLFHCAE